MSILLEEKQKMDFHYFIRGTVQVESWCKSIFLALQGPYFAE